MTINVQTPGGSPVAASAPQLAQIRTDLDVPSNAGAQTIADARITLQKGAALGLASLDALGKLATAQIPDSLLGNLNYQGTWNASTNVRSPMGGAMPAASTGNKGHYYLVSLAGTTAIDGESDWGLHDWCVSNGTAWTKVDNSDSGSSDASTIRATLLTGMAATGTALPDASDTVLSAWSKLLGWAGNFAANVRAAVLTGLSTATSTQVVAGDTVLVSVGKLQAQTNLKEKAWVTQMVTGTTLTLTADDDRKTFIFTNTSPITVTVPAAASGIRCEGIWGGSAGRITITPSSTTVNGAATAIDLADAAGSFVLVPTGTANDWTLTGTIGNPVGTFSFYIPTVADGDLIRYAVQEVGSILSVTTVAASGTCTVTGRIGATPLGGTANAASTTKTTQAHSSANAYASGNDIYFAASANAACVGLSVTVTYSKA